jgi:membrane protease subunit (stomatin/prohibitin family)
MGLFSSKTEGGMMDAIRCDQQQYLIWKWSPDGTPSKKENAIRYGSSLRVKDGEVAVFIYKQKDGPMQDFIEGPFDQTIKTANFPILASIVGLAFGGASPFQAEVYFINLSGNIQIKWGLPMFDNFDPRYPDFGVPTTARGSLTFNITDYKNFIKLNRMIGFDIEDFKSQIRSGFIGKMKSVLIDAPTKNGIPVIQIERRIEDINELAKNKIVDLMNDFGVNLKRLDIESIEIDKESEGYRDLKSITKDITSTTVKAQADVNIKNIYATQAINQENIEEIARIQRQEMQRAQQLATETNFIQTHQINIAGDIGKEMASHIGEIGQGGGIEGGGGMNPGSMMAGMAIGGAVGNQMAGMLNQQMGNLNQSNTPASQQGSIVCPKCNTVNQPSTKFCGSCGTPLTPQPIQEEQKQTCGNCKSQFPVVSKFCPNCGTPAIQEKFCLDCGTKILDGVKFCPNCGKSSI